MASSSSRLLLLLLLVLLLGHGSEARQPPPLHGVRPMAFDESYTQIFGSANLALRREGKRVHLSLDEATGAGFASQDLFLHGFFSAAVKLPADYAAGVVVAFYVPDERRQVREDPRRAGLRVSGQRARPRLAGADQRVRQRQHQRRTGGALRPPLRPHGQLPPLLNPLDTTPHHILRGRDADQGGGEDGGHGRGVPLQANVPLRHHLGRLRLGHPRRPLQGGLQVRAVRRPVRRPRDTGLPRQPHGPLRGDGVRHALVRGRRFPVCRAAQGDGVVQARPHVLLLLPRPPPVPGRPVGVPRRGAPAPVRPGRDEVRRRPQAPPRRARPPLRRRHVIPRGRRAHPPRHGMARAFRHRDIPGCIG